MKEIGTVYRTEDLSVFKPLIGNRNVKEGRKQALVESIDKNGYIPNPIIVNEKYQVIDGQGRLAACQELGKPIDYMIVPNIGISECMILNMNAKNWLTIDYIESYAKQGNINYERILDLSKVGFGIRTYMFANALYGGTGSNESIIKEGRAKSGERTHRKAKEALEYLKTLRPFIDKIDGRKTDIESALLFAYYDEKCDNERLSHCVSKYFNVIGNIISIRTAMDEVSKIYNKSLKGKPRLYLKEDYERFKYE